MIIRNHLISSTAFLLLAIIFSGCSSESNKSQNPDVPDLPPATVETDAHDHPSDGPHHGHLIELGKEEYHAEFIHDEKNSTVTIYILDGTAKNVVPIDSKEILINLKHDGRGEQFKLTALPDKGDPGDNRHDSYRMTKNSMKIFMPRMRMHASLYELLGNHIPERSNLIMEVTITNISIQKDYYNKLVLTIKFKITRF